MAKRKAAEPQTATAESFEDSLTELQSIVSELEDGSLGLEASLVRFERGVGLLRQCHVILESAEQKIETLTRFEDAGSLEPVDGVDRARETESGHDAATLQDLDSSKSSLF